MSNTWLQLPAQMGGTRFGPFSGGIIQIGTDGSQCQIVLAQQMGIAPVHVTVAVQGPGTYLVQPVQRGFGLFIARKGGGMSPVSAAVAANAGDALIIGTPAGPRFELVYEQEAPAPSSRQRNGSRGGGGGFAGALGKELMRQQRARWLMRNPLYREYYRLSQRYRTGAPTNPRVMVGLILGGMGALMALGTACLGGVGVLLRALTG